MADLHITHFKVKTLQALVYVPAAIIGVSAVCTNLSPRQLPEGAIKSHTGSDRERELGGGIAVGHSR